MTTMIDPSIFGGTARNELVLDPATGANPPEVPEVKLPANGLYSGPLQVQAEQSMQAGLRERANFIEAVGAGIAESDTARLLRALVAPADEPEAGYNYALARSTLDFVPTESDEEYLRGASSYDGLQHRAEVIRRQRQAQEAMGDSPLGGFVGLMIDPVYGVTGAAALKLGKLGRTAAQGRVIAGASNAAMNVGVMVAGEGPRDEAEFIVNAAASFAAGALVYRPGKGMVQADPLYPTAKLASAVSTVADTVDGAVAARAGADSTAGQWSVRRTMENFGPVGREISDLFFHPGKPSVEAHRVAVRSDLTRLQKTYEDQLQQAMAADGYGILKRITPWRSVEAAQAQARWEQRVFEESLRREQLARQGRPITYDGVDPKVKAMADALDALHDRALKELQAAGVEGAEDLVGRAGWRHRKWSASKVDDMEKAIIKTGKTAEEAHREVVRLVALSLRKANGWDDLLAYDIGAAIVNRAKRKGYFEDSLFNASEGAGTMKQLRDILTEEGLTGQRLERALEVLRQQSDDAGKSGFMKHRVDLDYRAAKVVGGQQFRVIDLLDNRLTHTVDQYLDGVSTQAAFARMGLKKRSDIEALRNKLTHSLKVGSKEMEEAVKLFDNIVARMEGRPLGDSMPDFLRLSGMYGRMIALANSGLWQLTEYATAMAEYGVLRTTKHMLKEMPLARKLFSDIQSDKGMATSLQRVLADHSQNNLRLRPFLYRFEDNFEVDSTSALHLAAQQAQQLVPYANVMKWIHGHQARVVSNLIVERLHQAAKGNKAAQAALMKYGIDRQVMGRLQRELPSKGFNVDSWSDGLWDAVRPAFANMMDEAVLHSRMGDMPAFAQFDNLGKFLFMYRSFMLTAHNKLLVGRFHRDGPGAVGLLMLYQFPLAYMAVQSQAVLSGKGVMSDEDAAKRALGVMGGLGAATELTNIAFGFNNQITTPGFIPFDRALGFASQVAEGDAKGSAKAALALTPLLGIFQPARSLTALATDEE